MNEIPQAKVDAAARVMCIAHLLPTLPTCATPCRKCRHLARGALEAAAQWDRAHDVFHHARAAATTGAAGA